MNHNMKNFSELKKLIDTKVKDFISDHNWDEVLRIFQSCPEQIFYHRKFLENTLKASKELNEFPVEKIVYLLVIIDGIYRR